MLITRFRNFLGLILLPVIFFAGCAFCEDNDIKIGFLARLRTTPEEFYNIVKNLWETQGWAIISENHSIDTAKFYDSLTLMQMALDAREIEEMALPDFVAEYLLKVNNQYVPCCISNSGTMYLCFGFMKDNAELMQKWNAAINSMREDWTLETLKRKYIQDFANNNSPYEYTYGNSERRKKDNDAVKFERFKNAPSVYVAITGDLPPVDYISEDGMPAGYNAALLAEIGRRLRVNIYTVNVNTRTRTAALVSGRADVVFWYEVRKSAEAQPDVPDGVILSEPYYEWDKFMHIINTDDE